MPGSLDAFISSIQVHLTFQYNSDTITLLCILLVTHAVRIIALSKIMTIFAFLCGYEPLYCVLIHHKLELSSSYNLLMSFNFC